MAIASSACRATFDCTDPGAGYNNGGRLSLGSKEVIYLQLQWLNSRPKMDVLFVAFRRAAAGEYSIVARAHVLADGNHPIVSGKRIRNWSRRAFDIDLRKVRISFAGC